MRRTALCLTALLVACGGVTEPAAARAIGTWALHDVNGALLPHPEGRYAVLADTLALGGGGAASETLVIALLPTSAGDTIASSGPARWVAGGDRVIVIHADVGQSDTLRLAGDTLTWALALPSGTRVAHYWRE